jgi:hypothetical protein
MPDKPDLMAEWVQPAPPVHKDTTVMMPKAQDRVVQLESWDNREQLVLAVILALPVRKVIKAPLVFKV